MRLSCCDPRAEWCARASMAVAIDHAQERARAGGFRQAVHRSLVHEQHSGGREFWIISMYRRDLTLAGLVKRRPQAGA